MANLTETYRGVVYPWHLDHMGHMNVQFYTARFDEATWHFFASLGITPTYLREAGCGMAAVEQKTAYLREVMAGALIRIDSELLERRDKSLRFLHRMYDAETGGEVANTEIVALHIDAQARKAVAFPPAIGLDLA
jgi:acyl-CoA thioester hydrolase